LPGTATQAPDKQAATSHGLAGVAQSSTVRHSTQTSATQYGVDAAQVLGAQLPPWQTWQVEQPPLCPSGVVASAGHASAVPEQAESAWQASPVWQTVPGPSFASGGQAALVPVHVSSTSQTPAEARQTVPALPGTAPQAPARQAATSQGLAGVGQSAAVRHSTQASATQ
jgi:hypothetical protein